jgi:hypothetical protein
VRQRQPERLPDDLRGRRRPEELATAARRTAGATAELGRLLERQLAVGEARTDRLHLARVLAVRRRQRDAARHEHARQIAHGNERQHHRGQPLSHVATPSTPLRVGSDRIRRRKIIAASLR